MRCFLGGFLRDSFGACSGMVRREQVNRPERTRGRIGGLVARVANFRNVGRMRSGGKGRMLDRDSLPVLVHPPIFTILVPFHDLGPSSNPSNPGSDPPFGKIIWQCYSELAGGGKNTLASPLEVNVFCPYLCTTPQGRDGPTATET
ncbi:hypothetical protein, partial [Sphingobacterium mizutaii]|uniref:hypothetical protein n=1 Tax=Sphingobacterium mizutaii TaxID=1010 RepID=UPI001BE3D444